MDAQSKRLPTRRRDAWHGATHRGNKHPSPQNFIFYCQFSAIDWENVTDTDLIFHSRTPNNTNRIISIITAHPVLKSSRYGSCEFETV